MLIKGPDYDRIRQVLSGGRPAENPMSGELLEEDEREWIEHYLTLADRANGKRALVIDWLEDKAA
jgi:hypothetical protein